MHQGNSQANNLPGYWQFTCEQMIALILAVNTISSSASSSAQATDLSKCGLQAAIQASNLNTSLLLGSCELVRHIGQVHSMLLAQIVERLSCPAVFALQPVLQAGQLVVQAPALMHVLLLRLCARGNCH